jgi:hypothetical protein
MSRSRRSLQALVTIIAIVGLAGVVPGWAALQTVMAQGGDDPSLSSAQYPPEAAQPAGAAQGGPWLSSANPPPGTPPELLSPPDTVSASAVDDTAAIEAVVSWRVVGSALKPRANDVSYAVSGTNPGCTYATAGSAATIWGATPDLPQGARVNSLRMYFDDTNVSFNSLGWFTIYDLFGDVAQEWSVGSSGSSGFSFNDTATISHTVNYDFYSYQIHWRPTVATGNLGLCGFRLFYEPPPFGVSFMPLIRK